MRRWRYCREILRDSLYLRLESLNVTVNACMINGYLISLAQVGFPLLLVICRRRRSLPAVGAGGLADTYFV